MNKRMKTQIDETLSTINVNESLEKRIMSLPQTLQKSRRRSMSALLACGLLMIALPVLAATNPAFRALLDQVSYRVADLLRPVALASESNGIRMEVIAAMNDDYTAVAYITLQDTTGDRLAGIIDLYDYGISGTNSSFSERIKYDESTQSATLRMICTGEEKVSGQKITLYVRSLLSGLMEWDAVDIGISLDTLPTVGNTTWLAEDAWLGMGGNGYDDELERNKGLKILPLGEHNIPIPDVDFATISNIGFIDGRLHVQIHWTKKGHIPANLDDHGFVWLVDSDGQRIPGNDGDFNVSFAADAEGTIESNGFNAQGLLHKEGNYYQEYIFVVDSDMMKAALQGFFATNIAYITGDWNVSFRIQPVKSFKQANCNLDIGTALIHTVSVSPLGWTILGDMYSDTDAQVELLVSMKDGTEQHLEISLSGSDLSNFEYHSIEEEPLDVEQIEKVFINGQQIQLLEK